MLASRNSPEDVIDGPIAWLNGAYISSTSAALPVTDLGLQGLAVTEMIRTYDRELFRLRDHLVRLERSLQLACIDQDIAGLDEICKLIARRNGSYVADQGDLGMVVFITAGGNPTYLGSNVPGPSVCVHTFELPLARWSTLIRDGLQLRVSDVRQIPEECVPAEIKSRSRLHWYLAARGVAKSNAGHAVLLNHDGLITETPTGNVFAVYGESVVTPDANVLFGVSRKVVSELCPVLGLRYEERPIRPEDLQSADEVFVASTPTGLLPVTDFNGQPVGNGLPGPVFFELCNAWSELVRIDIIEQITSAGSRHPGPDA